MNKLIAVLCVAMLAGCAGDALDDRDTCLDGKCDGMNGGTCEDPRYGDGTCQVDLSCAVPDIDCFVTFIDDAAAATWYAAFEAQLAREEGRAPRALVPSEDPRFVKMRELLDRGWEAFRTERPVGRLAEARPGLVVLEDAAVNAFVVPDLASDRSAFTVMVQTGAIDDSPSDEALLGLVMHELQHAAALHLIRGLKHAMARYYIAPPGSEPIGRRQANDPAVQQIASTWLAAAREVGPHVTTALDGFPTSGSLSDLFVQLMSGAKQQRPAECARAVSLYNQLMASIRSATEPLSGAFEGEPGRYRTAVANVLAAAEQECFAGYPHDLIAVLAGMTGQSPEAIESQMTPADRTLVKGHHVITGLANLTRARRESMRALQAQFEQTLRVPWSSLRYFSYEEDADDVTVPVMRAAGFSPTAQAEFLLAAGLPTDAAAQCAAVVERGQVPSYGIDLGDAHHATCWRAYHLHALAAEARSASDRTAASMSSVLPMYQLPAPRRLRDVIMH